MEIDEIRSIIGRSYWKFAKTMPHIPHYYTLRKHAKRDEDFVALVEFIHSHGYDDRLGRYFHRYLYLDGWKYWTMGEALESTDLINRARIFRPPRAIIQNPRPFRITLPWPEVYCVETRRMIPKQRELNFDCGDE